MSQQCTSYPHERPDGAKFCLECGTPFARRCPSCGPPSDEPDMVRTLGVSQAASAPSCTPSSQASQLLCFRRPYLRGLVALARGEESERHLTKAASLDESYGAVFYVARTRFELGRWLVGQGRSSQAEPLWELARATFEQVGATPSAAQVDALAGVEVTV